MYIEKPTMWRPEDLKTWPVLLEAGHETSLPKLQCALVAPILKLKLRVKIRISSRLTTVRLPSEKDRSQPGGGRDQGNE